jgi:glycosyltransferase involved in cell wall biosynthesis
MILPSISIVTPSFNQGQFIEETICSVLDQDYPNLDYIIIDGGSTDDTIRIIKKYEKHLKFWVSEKDKGQANAINKGLKHCAGSIFNWLNSDDYLAPGALTKIGSAFSDPTVGVVAGKVNNFSSTDFEIVANKNLSSSALMTWQQGTQFVQPGVWLRKDLLEKCGGIDENFHYAFDWDLLIRYLYHTKKIIYLNDVLVHFRLHSSSKTVSVLDRFAEEERRIIKKISQTEDFKDLHDICGYKISRSSWVDYLQKTVANQELNSGEKVIRIMSKIKNQPKDWAVTRMTLGALKSIISGE